jgi:hypothetical protein
MKNKSEPKRAELVRANINNFGKEFSHALTTALQAARTRRTATRLHFLFLPRCQNFRFAFRVTPSAFLIADLVGVT